MRHYLLFYRQDFKEEGYVIGHDVIAIRRNALPRRLAVQAVRRALFSPICRQSRDAVPYGDGDTWYRGRASHSDQPELQTETAERRAEVDPLPLKEHPPMFNPVLFVGVGEFAWGVWGGGWGGGGRFSALLSWKQAGCYGLRPFLKDLL